MSDGGDSADMEDVGTTPTDFFDHDPPKQEKIEVSLIHVNKRNLALHQLILKSSSMLVDVDIPVASFAPERSVESLPDGYVFRIDRPVPRI